MFWFATNSSVALASFTLFLFLFGIGSIISFFKELDCYDNDVCSLSTSMAASLSAASCDAVCYKVSRVGVHTLHPEFAEVSCPARPLPFCQRCLKTEMLSIERWKHFSFLSELFWCFLADSEPIFSAQSGKADHEEFSGGQGTHCL